MSKLYRRLPDCTACCDDRCNDCVPLLVEGSTHTVCRCFAAYPDSDAHTNALYWWGHYGSQAEKAAHDDDDD